MGKKEERAKFWSWTLDGNILLKEHDIARDRDTIWFAQPLKQREKTKYHLWIVSFVVQGCLKC